MQKIPKCINNLPATHICMNDKCNKPNPFICDANHDCKQHHRTCVKLEWTVFKQKLEQNRKIINPTFTFLCDKVDKMITKGIEQLKLELDNFNQWKKQYGGVKQIAEFYECIQLNREARWTGKDIYQLKNSKGIKFDDIKIQTQKIQSVVAIIKAKKSEFIKIIRDLYEGYKIQASSNIMKMQLQIDESKCYYLLDLCKKLKQINQNPKNLELKFVVNQLFSV